MLKKNNRSVELEFDLTELAQSFGYNLEVDSFEDVFHNGYSKAEIRKSVSLSKDLDKAPILFPYLVGQVIEDAERDAYAVAIRNARINALVETLEKIDVGTVEYQSLDGTWITKMKARIESASVDPKENKIKVTVLNPEHLINTVISGVGMFAPDLSIDEPESEAQLKAKFHNLTDFFDVYGITKASDELGSQYSPSIDDNYVEEQVRERLLSLENQEIADAVKDVVEDEELTPGEALEIAVELTKCSKEEIKSLILKSLDTKKETWEKA